MNESAIPRPSLGIGQWSLVIPALGVALILGLSLLPPSSTRLYAWPWAAFAAAGWVLPIVIALYRLARNRPHARLGGMLDAGFGLLALTATASALASPLRGAVLPHLLPFLGICALSYAVLPALQPALAIRTRRVSGVVLAMVLIVSLVLWLQPWDALAGFGTRNAQPFGHANITGSVAVLAATWLAFGAVRETGRARVLFILGVILAIITAISSESRGAVIALAAAGTTAAAIILIQRGRPLIFIALVAILAGGTVASNARLRDLVIHGRWSAVARESNDQRIAMLVGGLRLGAEGPLLGWGAGSVPHVFPRVRAGLPGDADNFLHLHNTPAQFWATLGSAGLLAGLLVAGGLATRLRTPWTPERIVLASGLVGGATVMLFDHPFATPIFAVLAAAHLAAWVSSDPNFQLIGDTRRPGLVPLGAALLLVPALLSTGRDLAARSAYADALDQAAIDNASGYVNSLRRALRFSPDDPYYAHMLAAYLGTGHPLHNISPAAPQGAISLLKRTLAANPDLEYAHYNLGWLLLNPDPSESAAHFLNAARLAPQRGGVYLGLGFARIRLNDTEGAVRAFAAEWLLNPTTAWSPLWTQPPLDALRPRIHALAVEALQSRRIDDIWTDLDTPVTLGAPYRRLRTGYGVLMGHPDGPPPVDFNIQQKVILPDTLRTRVPKFGWLPGQALLDFVDSDRP